jgi:hypothetical protein
VIDEDFQTPEELEAFVDSFDAAVHPEVEGQPILRVASLDFDRVPGTHVRIDGVPDDVLAVYFEGMYDEELPLEDLVAQHGGTLHKTPCPARSLAMTRAKEGGYRVYELDAAGERTEFDAWYESLHDALRASALTHGHPPGTLTWKEFFGNK